jgi:hypothetical protein
MRDKIQSLMEDCFWRESLLDGHWFLCNHQTSSVGTHKKRDVLAFRVQVKFKEPFISGCTILLESAL